MLLNLLLLISVILAIFLLIRQLRKSDVDKQHILPTCKFSISKIKYDIDKNTRIAKFSISSKNKNRFYRDFPLGFKFYSLNKFRSKIRITYNVSDYKDDKEVIYDRIVEFEIGDSKKTHIYYINDIVAGTLDIEIYTSSQYGKPTILFEILQNNKCHLDKNYKVEINFPS